MTSALRRLSVATAGVLALLAGPLTPAAGQLPAAQVAPHVAPQAAHQVVPQVARQVARPRAAAGGGPARITLVTGDVVELAPAGGGRYAATVRPGSGREQMSFHTSSSAASSGCCPRTSCRT